MAQCRFELRTANSAVTLPNHVATTSFLHFFLCPGSGATLQAGKYFCPGSGATLQAGKYFCLVWGRRLLILQYFGPSNISIPKTKITSSIIPGTCRASGKSILSFLYYFQSVLFRQPFRIQFQLFIV